MRVFFILLVLIACDTVDIHSPTAVAEAYLSAIEKEDFKRAYRYIDHISKQHTTLEEFEDYWRNHYFKRFGKPYKHKIHDAWREGKYVLVEYTWHLKKPPELQEGVVYLPQRSYRLKMRYEFGSWAVKFRKYRVIRERSTPYGKQIEIVE